MPHIIRTSDRLTFKSCRQKWDLGSKMRQNYEPIVGAKPLEFGIAFHEAMEVYYDPATWNDDREIVEAEARLRFHEECKTHQSQYLKIKNAEGMDVEVEIDFAERKALGDAMLTQYFRWAKKNDNFTPKLVEIEFEVPIPCPPSTFDTSLPPHFRNVDGFLYYRGEPVVYQGRVDLVLEDEYGNYWIDDHKTAAQAGQTQWLDLDDQITSYCWALQRMLDIRIKGFMYTEIFKKIIHPPAELKNGGLSKNKQQDTSYELYLEAITTRGLRVADYQDFLNYLRENPKEVVRRIKQPRSQKTLEIFERRLFLEVIDMLNNPSIYPNPSKMACNGCWFFTPCLSIFEGSDVDYVLSALYNKRDTTQETA